jgi:hypothetical protein
MLTPREQASGVFTTASSMGTRRVRGADMEQVIADRLAFLDNAEQIISSALAGPPRRFAVEPDDDSLNAMLTQVQARRGAIQTYQQLHRAT